MAGTVLQIQREQGSDFFFFRERGHDVVPYGLKGHYKQLPGTYASARVTAAQARSVQL